MNCHSDSAMQGMCWRIQMKEIKSLKGLTEQNNLLAYKAHLGSERNTY